MGSHDKHSVLRAGSTMHGVRVPKGPKCGLQLGQGTLHHVNVHDWDPGVCGVRGCVALDGGEHKVDRQVWSHVRHHQWGEWAWYLGVGGGRGRWECARADKATTVTQGASPTFPTPHPSPPNPHSLSCFIHHP